MYPVGLLYLHITAMEIYTEYSIYNSYVLLTTSLLLAPLLLSSSLIPFCLHYLRGETQGGPHHAQGQEVWLQVHCGHPGPAAVVHLKALPPQLLRH